MKRCHSCGEELTSATIHVTYTDGRIKERITGLECLCGHVNRPFRRRDPRAACPEGSGMIALFALFSIAGASVGGSVGILLGRSRTPPNPRLMVPFAILGAILGAVAGFYFVIHAVANAP